MHVRTGLGMAAVVIVSVACAGSPQTSAQSPAAQTPTNTYVPYSPAPPPTPTPLHNPSLPPYEYDTGASGAYPPNYVLASSGTPDAAGLSCRLPIYAGGPGSGGFLVLPDRTFVADPRSSVSAPSPPAGAVPVTGIGPGFGLSYDRALAKWLPVNWNWVAPDGKHYAYPLSTGVDVVDAGSSSQVVVGGGRAWQLIDVESDRVYAEVQNQPGLWALPFSGGATQISAGGYWDAVGGGAAYGTVTSGVPPGVATQIERLDLKSGATQPWFQVDGASSYVVGFDGSGNPMIAVSPQQQFQGYPTYIWVVKGLSDASVLTGGQINYPIVPDGHGLWFSGSAGGIPGIYLYTGHSMQWVASVGGVLAGDCG